MGETKPRPWEAELVRRFPFMARARAEDAEKIDRHFTYDIYGFQMPDGWKDLIFDLCAEIQRLYDAVDIPNTFRPTQIKEKWGSLRVYYRFEGEPEPAIQAIDGLGGGGLRFAPGSEPIHRKIAALVREAERKSRSVCQRCGAASDTPLTRTDLRYVQTLCQPCYQRLKAKIETARLDSKD